MFDYQSEIFVDRRDAGRRLADRLSREANDASIVLGLARGGVVVAAEVAKRLGAKLDVMVVRKLGAPFSEELAIGAVTANGGTYLNEDVMQFTGAHRDYVEREIDKQRKAARAREDRYRSTHAAPSLEGRHVILIDDGLATGASMIAAARSARSRRPSRLTLAVPVGAPESCREISSEADAVFCLMQPIFFGAVGRFYNDFSEVSDEEVEQILAFAQGQALQRGSAS